MAPATTRSHLAMPFRFRASISLGTTSLPRPKAQVSPVRSMPHVRCVNAKPIGHNPGSRQSRWKLLASSAICIVGSWFAAAMLALPSVASGQELRPYVVRGDSIAESLTGVGGDPARGRALVLERTSTCILCHSGPFPEEKFQGDLAPNLAS